MQGNEVYQMLKCALNLGHQSLVLMKEEPEGLMKELSQKKILKYTCGNFEYSKSDFTYL
jgi:hypothetical protein